MEWTEYKSHNEDRFWLLSKGRTVGKISALFYISWHGRSYVDMEWIKWKHKRLVNKFNSNLL